MSTHIGVEPGIMAPRPNRQKLQTYKDQWAALPPGPQAEEYERESAVQRAEQQLRSEGQAFIDGERERLAKRAAAISQSYADLQAAARAITQACKDRIVDVEEVGDQLDELEKQARANRAAVARIEEQNTRNEERAADPVAVAEHLYDKYPILVSPADPQSNGGMLPAFRTESEQQSRNTAPVDPDEFHARKLERRASATRKRI